MVYYTAKVSDGERALTLKKVCCHEPYGLVSKIRADVQLQCQFRWDFAFKFLDGELCLVRVPRVPLQVLDNFFQYLATNYMLAYKCPMSLHIPNLKLAHPTFSL